MASNSRDSLEAANLTDATRNVLRTPELTVHPRPTFRRQSSSATSKSVDYHVVFDTTTIHEPQRTEISHYDSGLGISYVPSSPERIRRVPVGSKETFASADSTPDKHSGGTSQATTHQNTPYGRDWKVSDDRLNSFQSSNEAAYLEIPDREMLQEQPPNSAPFECATHKDILASSMSWLTISIIILAVYSTLFSGIFFFISTARPKWGQTVGTNKHLSYSNASLLSALLAKTVELSFVTVFVTFLGQALSRKAFRQGPLTGGISIAEMSMRTWIMQPGALITHWENTRYASRSLLGAITLAAAFAAIFYTTAAEALVAPKLKDSGMEHRLLSGTVSSSFADSVYMAQNCETPVQDSTDPVDKGVACLQVEHAGQGWHNFKSYLNSWAESVAVGNVSGPIYQERLPPTAMLFDNTTVQGQWIETKSVTNDSLKYGRFVQNITMAMPHANVFNAARDPLNGILQPEDLEGSGQYIISASVPAPATNIMCVGLTDSELAPMIYTGTLDVSTWANETLPGLLENASFPGTTAVDHLFDFGQDTESQRAPIFPKLPMAYNTVLSYWQEWGQVAVYLLAKPGSPSYGATENYTMCSLKAMLYPNCTTRYFVTQNSGKLEVHCDSDPRNTIPYSKSQTLAPYGVIDLGWKDVGTAWIQSLSLGSGISDGDAAGARIITQSIPALSNDTTLANNLPSIGELLSVLAACTLLLSSATSPFIHYWNYSEPALETPQTETFNAFVTYRDYASGGTQRWQGLFYVILLAVFVLNAFCLIYLIWNFRGDGQVTDYTEPQNLFALAVNSPPSRTLRGSCGAGPEGCVLASKWQVGMQRLGDGGSPQHPHFYVKCPDDDRVEMATPVVNRSNRRSVRQMADYDVVDSPAVEQYVRLSGKWNSIL